MPFRVPDGVSDLGCATIPGITQTPHAGPSTQLSGFPRFDVSGRVALVTGAARGLGRAIALALAHAGADVALGLRDRASDGGLAEEIARMGRQALPLQMDVTRMDQIPAAVNDAAAHFGRLDILVNNAGVAIGSPAE